MASKSKVLGGCFCVWTLCTCWMMAAPIAFMGLVGKFVLKPMAMMVVPNIEDTRMFPSANTMNMLQMAPKDYPENLQGMIWMDQVGDYAHSDILMGAPDLTFSFANAAVPLDRKKRTITVDVAGHNWQWMNTMEGYASYKILKTIGFRYYFEWNEDYSSAQIYPSLFTGRFFVPKLLLSFTMVKQNPPNGTCPPAADALKKEKAKCATWNRVSSSLFQVRHYYALQIVGSDGKPVQPYFDAFVDFATRTSVPDFASAKLLGVDKTPGMSFTAIPGAQAKKGKTEL